MTRSRCLFAWFVLAALPTTVVAALGYLTPASSSADISERGASGANAQPQPAPVIAAPSPASG